VTTKTLLSPTTGLLWIFWSNATPKSLQPYPKVQPMLALKGKEVR